LGEVHAEFWCGYLKEISHLEDLGVDCRIILKWIFKKLVGGVDWIALAGNKERWRAVLSAAMNLAVP
jgi:hypothetical protein